MKRVFLPVFLCLALAWLLSGCSARSAGSAAGAEVTPAGTSAEALKHSGESGDSFI